MKKGSQHAINVPVREKRQNQNHLVFSGVEMIAECFFFAACMKSPDEQLNVKKLFLSDDFSRVGIIFFFALPL
jgi:hypothetical protein